MWYALVGIGGLVAGFILGVWRMRWILGACKAQTLAIKSAWLAAEELYWALQAATAGLMPEVRSCFLGNGEPGSGQLERMLSQTTVSMMVGFRKRAEDGAGTAGKRDG